MNEWNIQARGHHCQACHRPFADKEKYHTLLFDSKQQLLRQDICTSCWENQESHGSTDRKGFVSYWQGQYEVPPPPLEPIKKENAESLLRKLTELNDPRYAAAAYILAVMLERKRLLKVKEQLIRDGHRVFLYEHPKSGDLFTIPDPELHLDQLTQVQQDVADLMEHGLNPPAATEPALASPPLDAPAPAGEAQAPLEPALGASENTDTAGSEPAVTAEECQQP